MKYSINTFLNHFLSFFSFRFTICSLCIDIGSSLYARHVITPAACTSPRSKVCLLTNMIILLYVFIGYLITKSGSGIRVGNASGLELSTADMHLTAFVNDTANMIWYARVYIGK